MALELLESNPYANGKINVFDDGSQELERDMLDIKPAVGDKWHVVSSGDNCDKLADKYYSSIRPDAAAYWWVIADANEDIDNPLDLSDIIGQRILIPNLNRIGL